MRAVVQRVAEASVCIDKKMHSTINGGLLVLLGVESGDMQKDIDYIVDKLLHLRIFEDSAGKMNLSIRDTGGSILLVSQFTLSGDARKGRRPNFSRAERPEQAKLMYESTRDALHKMNIDVKTGQFGAMMDVHLINSGPVTILLDSHRNF